MAESVNTELGKTQEQLFKRDKWMEELEKSLSQSLEEVKSGVEMLKHARKKIKQLETDLGRSKGELAQVTSLKEQKASWPS